MAHNLENSKPLGGLNYDDSDLQINHSSGGGPLAWQDYRYAKNIRNAVNSAARGKALTNVKSTVEITKYLLPYTVSFPAGKNKVIGTLEDTKYNTVIFCVWNSNGNHQILRYYRNNTDPVNPYGEVQQVMCYNFGWTRKTRITDMQIVYGTVTTSLEVADQPGDLLYWSDPVPKKINLSKANICNKHKTWRIYAPASFQAFTNAGNFQLLFQDINNTVLFGASIDTPAGLTNEEGLVYIADRLNQSYGTYVSAEACGCKLIIEEKNTAVFYASIGGGLPLKMYADNWYGTTLVDRFFDRCKWLPGQAPQPLFGQDTNNDRNYVKQKVFQFRLGYRYDDLEDSCLGVWSQIATNNLGCDGTSNELFNYVDVDFNDPALVDDTTLILLKEVKFVVRELNTGTNKLVITTTPCDYLDWNQADQKWYCHYKFYNDILSTPIDANTAAQLFDDVPLESGAELFTKNRIVEGAIKTGYDAPACIEAKAQMEFGDTPNPKLVKITGKIRIQTWGLVGTISGANNFYNVIEASSGLKKYPFWESPLPYINNRIRRGGIFANIGATEATDRVAFFGGGNYKDGGGGSMGDFAITPNMINATYDQRLPEGGWPVYCAGTNYFTVSKQVNPGGLPVDGSGALDVSTADKIENIGLYLDSNYGTALSPATDLYSTFEILVPENSTYVLRLASHWCSFGDELGKGFAYNLAAGSFYQNTSTNVWGVIDNNGALLKDHEIKIVVGSSDVDAGTFLVADLAPPDGIAPYGWRPINCYIVSDENNASDINSSSFTGVPVEKTVVTYGLNGQSDYIVIGVPHDFPNGIYDTGWQNSCISDHNGYFFGIGGWDSNADAGGARPSLSAGLYFPISAYQSKNGAINNTWAIRDMDTLIFRGTYSDYVNKTLSPENFNVDANFGSDINLIYGFVSANKTGARQSGSTFIQGQVVDQNGNALPGATVVYENGRIALTAQSGDYSILVWSDMLTPNIGQFASEVSTFTPLSTVSRSVDSLIFELPIFCVPSYPNGQEYNGVNITPFGAALGQYNPTNPYLIPDFIINEGNNPAIKAPKRGGKDLYGIRCYDEAGRLCSVVSAIDMYVPFITEDIGKYGIEDFSGTPYPANTFKYGKPSVKWVLDPATVFPAWVKTFQWMRTKNTIYGRYLQWVANQVTYLSATATATTPEIETSFQNADAVAIKISISNITGYYAANNDSNVGYQFESGDRMRLIANRTLVNYQGINDFKVTSYDSSTQSIIIKPEGFPTEIQSGTLLEIFNPKSVATEDEQIYYEVGEVVNVTNGIPEKYNGIFTNGDTYWRGRLIIVNDDATKFAAAYPVTIESASLSDFYISEAQDIGRVGTIDPNFKQIELPTGGRSSGQFLPGTASNGLSTFDPNLMPTFEADRRYDRIQRMFFEQNNLMLICSNKEVSNYINRQTLYQAEANTGIVSLSGEFFGTQFIHAQNLGTDLPATTVTDSGKIFGWRNNIANVWVYRGDGEKVISDEKMITFFDKLREDGVADAVAVYDRYHEEYIITYARKYKAYVPMAIFTDNTVTVVFDTLPDFALDADVDIQIPPISAQVNWTTVEGVVTAITIIEGKYWVTITADNNINLPSPRQQQIIYLNVIYSLPETIAFYQGSDELREPGVTERWKTFYDFTPENYSALGQELIGFVNGQPWIFNKNDALRNNFFGVQYKSQIAPVFNEQPMLKKVFNALWMTLVQTNGGNSWYAPVIRNMYGQLSRLKAANWGKSEGNFAIPFLRDLNTTVVTNPILNGKELRSESLTVELENDSTEEFTMYSMRANHSLSERTSK